MITLEQITEMVLRHLDGTSMFPVDIQVKPSNKIFIYLDGDQGVTIHDCQSVSRFLESNLDRDQEDFELTVSSCGADRPLKFIRQYPKHKGRTLELITLDGKTFTGILLEVHPDSLEVAPAPSKKEPQKEPVTIPFDQIKTAKVIISFS